MWKPVVCYEGYYEVNEAGSVRIVGGVEIDQHLDDIGYWFVYLFKNDRRSPFLVRRLVARAFLGPCPWECKLCNKDNLVWNNHLNNLVYRRRVLCGSQ